MPEPPADLRLFAVHGLPEIEPGADLAGLILAATADNPIQDGDLVVVAQKAVSKAEGRLLDLRTAEPSPFARTIADAHDRDPRHIDAILRETPRRLRLH